jgi:UTP--glucose-1-phosphate uridylyltransferase
MIRKAVIPAAGSGTRLLPATKLIPKEMLPVAGVPLIHHCVEEAVRSGIREACIVLNPRRAMAREYFQSLPRGGGPYPALLRRLNALSDRIRLRWAWQEEPRGLADAILCARAAIGDEPFALMLPDNLAFAKVPLLVQMRETFRRYRRDTVAIARIPASRASAFSVSGRIEFESAGGRSVRVRRFLPKGRGYYPRSLRAPVVRSFARAILLPHFFEHAARLRSRVKGELDDGRVLREILRRGDIMGHLVEGVVFDAGNLRGFAEANAWMIK